MTKKNKRISKEVEMLEYEKSIKSIWKCKKIHLAVTLIL